MKTSDLPAEIVLNTIKELGKGNPMKWAFLWDIQDALKDYPSKVVLSKLKNLVKKNIIVGCACGCRGDFYVI